MYWNREFRIVLVLFWNHEKYWNRPFISYELKLLGPKLEVLVSVELVACREGMKTEWSWASKLGRWEHPIILKLSPFLIIFLSTRSWVFEAYNQDVGLDQHQTFSYHYVSCNTQQVHFDSKVAVPVRNAFMS